MRIRPLILFSLALGASTCLARQQQNPPAQSQNQSPAPDQKQSQQQSQDQKPAKKPTTADENPFPEDISRKAAQPDSAATPPTSGNPAPDAKPAPDYSSSRLHLEDLDKPDDAESRISDGAGGYIHNPRLAAEDVKVGGFYLKKGDYKGAYTRFKEATRVNPEDANAVFGLAEAARGLNRNDEAVENYRIYLDAFPDGGNSKAARKALAALAAASGK